MPDRTPLYAITAQTGASFIEDAGWLVPDHFGDPPSEYQQAREGAVLFDVSPRGKLELTGSDAARFLHNLSTNDILGLMPGAEFEQGSVRLDAGDHLILYSDGVVEATDASGEEFGEERLLAVVQAHSEKPAEVLRDAILCAVDAFTGTAPQQDDRTLVVAVYLESEWGEALETAGTRTTWSPPVMQPTALTPIGG